MHLHSNSMLTPPEQTDLIVSGDLSPKKSQRLLNRLLHFKFLVATPSRFAGSTMVVLLVFAGVGVIGVHFFNNFVLTQQWHDKGIIGALIGGGSTEQSQGGGSIAKSPSLASQPTSTPVASDPATEASGWLHTDGTSIKDSTGKVFRFNGVGFGGMGQPVVPSGGCKSNWVTLTAADMATIHSLGFNTIRLTMAWDNIEPSAPTVGANGVISHAWNQPYLTALDTIITEAKAQGIVIILDMHQGGWSPAFTSGEHDCGGQGMPSWLYTNSHTAKGALDAAKCEFFTDVAEPGVIEKPQEGLAAAWAMLAARYTGNSTVVGADMINEPNWEQTCVNPDLVGLYERVGNSIHAINSNMLLMAEGTPYQDYTDHGLLLSRRPAIPNLVYSLHYYPANWANGTTHLTVFQSQATQWNVPLWIGEFNAFDEGLGGKTVDPIWQADLATLMAYCRQYNISWTFWQYDGGSSLYLNGTQTLNTSLVTGLQTGFN